MAYKDELLLEKAKRDKKKKKRNSAKMSKIKLKKKIINKLNDYNFVSVQYKMSLKFGDIKANEKEFHRSIQPIYLSQVKISNIVISDEFKLDDGVKKIYWIQNS